MYEGIYLVFIRSFIFFNIKYEYTFTLKHHVWELVIIFIDVDLMLNPFSMWNVTVSTKCLVCFKYKLVHVGAFTCFEQLKYQSYITA